MSGNQLSGGVPSSLENLKKLRVVDFSRNSLSGIIPDSIGNLPQLLKLDFSSNSFSGRIPESFVNLKSLEFLDLDNNNLEGQVPEELSGLEFVSEINLENNSLSGRLPFSVNFTSRIGVKLKLSGNSGLCIDEVGGRQNGSRFDKLRELKHCSSNDSNDNPNAAIWGESSSSFNSEAAAYASSVSLPFQVMIIFFWVLSGYLLGF
ncbi:Leucine-rich repeat receptor protein kinase EMS1 [Linum grandiflorum]